MDEKPVAAGNRTLCREAALFSRAWTGLSETVTRLSPDDFERPSSCRGWLVRDLICHLVIDAQDVLITLATPVDAAPTITAETYWKVVEPPTGEDPLDALIPRLAAAYGDPRLLQFHLGDLGPAAHRAALLADPEQTVSTQDEVLEVREFLRAYVLEWTLHHLDLCGGDEADIDDDALAESRRQVEAVIGSSLPRGLNDTAALLIATGRRAPTQSETRILGPRLVGALPISIG